MKTLILLFSVLFTTISFAQVPNYVPTNGLVGWWPFNGNANDVSGNGNNGFVANINVVPTTDRNGISNNAYQFLGGGYCGLPSSIGLDNMTSRTLSLWFKHQMPQYISGYILVSTNNTWGLGVNPQFQTHKINGFCILSNQHYGTAQITITPSVWTNVVFICDSINQQSKFYINGLLVSNNVLNSQIQTNTPNPALYIGGVGSNNSYYGSIDDIGIWNRALTDCEIQNLYTSSIPTNTMTAATACNSYLWNGTTYTASGVYTGTTTNCVTEFLNLTITPSSTNTTTASACDSYTWNGQTYSASGTYTGTTTNCVTESLDLTITPSSTNTTTVAACNNYAWNGTTYTSSGVYTGTTTNCVTQALNLTINTNTSSSISQTALDSYTWPVNNQTYTTTGAYTTVIPNASGCDSTITLNLTMSFTGINDLSASKLSIYPNPTNGDFTITGLELLGSVSSLSLTDMNGKVVKVLDTKATKFSMASIKPGVYFLTIISGNKQEVLKIVKE